MADPAIDEPTHRALGLTDDEFEVIRTRLDREPNHLELAMYSVMWSEHCSYKSSRIHLKRFPTEAPWVLVGPGEGAGVIDVGDDIAAAIRIESHNHPSAIEPYQGAATGVGGILRDIFSMGARPIAVMDPLRLGPLDDPRSRWIAEGVVSGISGYGNSVGVPTIGGETVFDECYADNPLVNVLCLGLMPKERLVLARAEGVGNLAVLLGSTTGRDGIGGVSVLASAGFSDDEADAQKRPSVQVGDPFEEKRLIEACLELLGEGLAVGVQDLGGAGITCATAETAAKGGAGMDVFVDVIPRREPNMEPFEVMISESQERMLAIVEPERLDEVLAIAERWEVRATVDRAGDRLGLPAGVRDARAARCSPTCPPSPWRTRRRSTTVHVPRRRTSTPVGPTRRRSSPAPADSARTCCRCCVDTSWVWSQYDHMLFLNTVEGPGGDAAVLRLKHPTTGCGHGQGARADAPTATTCGVRWTRGPGAAMTVAESVMNLAVVGARPLALVNCLNFGNPEHPEVMWQLSEAVDGLSEALDAFGVPCIGGNVSLYNESRGPRHRPDPGHRPARHGRPTDPTAARCGAGRGRSVGVRGVDGRRAVRVAVGRGSRAPRPWHAPRAGPGSGRRRRRGRASTREHRPGPGRARRRRGRRGAGPGGDGGPLRCGIHRSSPDRPRPALLGIVGSGRVCASSRTSSGPSWTCWTPTGSRTSGSAWPAGTA